jgi:hypothetical protein
MALTLASQLRMGWCTYLKEEVLMITQLKFVNMCFSLSLLVATQAMAVPQLRVTAGDHESSLATIYPDSEKANLFYYLPNTGSLAVNKAGYPIISLTYQDLDNPDEKKGGGFLTGVLEAGITPALQKELDAFTAKYPAAVLTVVPFGNSYMALSPPAAEQPPNSPDVAKFVPDPAPANGDMKAVVSAQSPPKEVRVINPQVAPVSDDPSGMDSYWKKLILPPHAGVAETQEGFSAKLTKEGATLFRAAMRGQNLLNLYLCFQVLGVLPTTDATITINYDRVYSYFAASVSGGWGFWGWSLSAAVEKLIESGDIQIVITGANDKQEDYVMAVAKDLAARFFTPTLTAAPAGSTGGSFNFVQYGFNATYKEEKKSVTWHLQERKYVTDDRCVTLPVTDMAPFADHILIDATRSLR